MKFTCAVWNRAKLLWSYLRRSERVPALPVEYIVETTAKCNLYCPMCPRETHKQPKEDMTDEIFERLVEGAAHTGEHMMLIGLGEPFMDRKIFDRIEYCERHGISTLLSTNGTFLDEEDAAASCWRFPLAHITLSFDGASKETFEHYRKGARFEKVRDNFVRFARMKHARGSKMQIVVQMVRMPGNAHEVDEFRRFWSERGRRRPGARQGRRDQSGAAGRPSRAGPRRVTICGAARCTSSTTAACFRAARATSWMGRRWAICRDQPLREIFNSDEMRRLRRLHAEGRAGEIDMCARCCTRGSASAAGGRQSGAARQMGAPRACR